MVEGINYVNVSWLFLVQHLPCKIYDRILFPYSHYTEAEIQTITHVEFIRRSGTTLHHIKGRNDDLQEYEELLAFYTSKQERILVIKNLRSHLAACFRNIPVEEARRLKIERNDILFAPDIDYRPVLEETYKERKKSKSWKYLQYTYFPYKILDQQVLDLLRSVEYKIIRTGQEWYYINLEIQPGTTREIIGTEINCTQSFAIEIKAREGIRNIDRIIGDFEFVLKRNEIQ